MYRLADPFAVYVALLAEEVGPLQRDAAKFGGVGHDDFSAAAGDIGRCSVKGKGAGLPALAGLAWNKRAVCFGEGLQVGFFAHAGGGEFLGKPDLAACCAAHAVVEGGAHIHLVEG